MKFAGMCFAILVLSAASLPVDPSRSDAAAAFRQLSILEGTWTSTSTKGWTEISTYEVTAKGSVILSRSHFVGEPNDGMVTTFHLDGNRLLLTHYCEAKNQPTLVASSVEDGGRRIRFIFLSGTNMKSRDDGHMDTVTFEIVDRNHFKSRWGWFAEGKETWFEEVESVRAPETAAPSRAGASYF